jgi:hypothetical protein
VVQLRRPATTGSTASPDPCVPATGTSLLGLVATILCASCRSSPTKLASPSAPDPRLQCVLLHVDPLDEELNDRS